MRVTMRCLPLYLRLLVFGGMIGLGACSRSDPLSKDPAIANRQVMAAVPLGTSETRAKKSFSDRGFQFSSLDSEPTNRLIVGTYTTAETMWQVGFIIIENKVAARTVSVTNLRSSGK